MLQTGDFDDNMDQQEEQQDDDEEEDNEENAEANAEEANEAEANEGEQAEEGAPDFAAKRAALRKQVNDAADALDAAEGKNGAAKQIVINKIQEKRQIGTRMKQVPGAPYKYFDHTIRKYKDEDYAQEIEMQNYEHRLEKLQKKLKTESAKAPEYEGAKRAADKLIVKEKERIAKEDAAILKAKKEKERRSREMFGYWDLTVPMHPIENL